eukprot:gnl/TRDRNA2_/TRDRNA2_64744_c0_seq1.p1 gnl/TRDRNA2_/TRDRNA2_64744_c0~~gnl/TRDRNA2_/TRDRNA2_64744_c0_seq1.p1  ORF type:complete len:288 (+),score=61.88 gnl/TRDRNA2_/TRDRNA2_64744_c0_seq1:78-941(+)
MYLLEEFPAIVGLCTGSGLMLFFIFVLVLACRAARVLAAACWHTACCRSCCRRRPQSCCWGEAHSYTTLVLEGNDESTERAQRRESLLPGLEEDEGDDGKLDETDEQEVEQNVDAEAEHDARSLQEREWQANQALANALHEKDPILSGLLIGDGANPKALLENGMPVLHLAVQLKDVSLCKILLRHNADPQVADEFGATSLHVASNLALERVALVLIKNGAKVNARDKEGHTPLKYVKRRQEQVGGDGDGDGEDAEMVALKQVETLLRMHFAETGRDALQRLRWQQQ